MNLLYIYAHPNACSFNATLKEHALSVLRTSSHTVCISDLYHDKFNSIASWDDFQHETQQTQYFLAQQDAFQHHQLARDIKNEIDKIEAADHLIFQFPLWWFSAPAILKGWFDRVLVKGFAYDAGKVFDSGLLKGKTASIITSTQSPEETYQRNGLHGATIETFLNSIHHTLHFVGIKTFKPLIIYNAFNLNEKRTQAIFIQLTDYLQQNLPE